MRRWLVVGSILPGRPSSDRAPANQGARLRQEPHRLPFLSLPSRLGCKSALGSRLQGCAVRHKPGDAGERRNCRVVARVPVRFPDSRDRSGERSAGRLGVPFRVGPTPDRGTAEEAPSPRFNRQQVVSVQKATGARTNGYGRKVTASAAPFTALGPERSLAGRIGWRGGRYGIAPPERRLIAVAIGRSRPCVGRPCRWPAWHLDHRPTTFDRPAQAARW